MLGKLIKYEIRATGRIFLPLYGLILAFALMNRLFRSAYPDAVEGLHQFPFDFPAFLNGLTMTVYVILIVVLFVGTLILTIQRFRKGLLSDEGYLMFTLPVKVHSHIDCRMIVTLMWTVLSLLVSALSIWILSADGSTAEWFRESSRNLQEIFARYGNISWLILAECIAFFAVSVLAGTLQIYAALAVGNLGSSHRQLASFGAYLGFGIIQMFLLFALGANLRSSAFSRWLGGIVRGHAPEELLAAVLGCLILYAALFGAAFYALTVWILSRKLNLE